MLKAVVFDFDGLILDTETPRFEAWREIFSEFGCTLSLSEWVRVIGQSPDAHDFAAVLEDRVGRPLDRVSVRRDHQDRENARIGALTASPGVEALIEAARDARLSLAIASSSDLPWVEGHLRRLGLLDAFPVLSCASSELPAKPAPDVYFEALSRLDVAANGAVALEDSQHGVHAALAAGLACVAVPNPLTRGTVLMGATMQRDTLEGLTVDMLEALVRRQ
jgi:HAD superfamily hydrolase (TIGR01509 family)